MKTSTRINNKGQNVRTGAVHLEYLKSTEYMVNAKGQHVSSSFWLGDGLKALKLKPKSEVHIAVMEQLAMGRAPNGDALRQNAGSNDRVGIDSTYSAEKGFSIMFAAANPFDKETLLQSYSSAVEEALTFELSHASARTGKAGMGKKFHEVKAVVSAHTHFGSRDLDPQIHIHALIYNLALCPDGKWRAMDTERMCSGEVIRASGALCRAQHAMNLRKLGFGIIKDRRYDADGRETGEVFFKIAGISDELTKTFSKRREAIVAYQEEHGGTFQQACKATRKHKDEPTYAELVSVWGETLDQMRVDQPGMVFQDIESLKGLPCEFDTFDDAKILEDLHKNEAKFTKTQIIERIALENVGQMGIKEILVEAEAFIERNHIVRLEQGSRSRFGSDEPEFAAQWMIDMEQEIGLRGRKRIDDVSVKVDPKIVQASIKKIEQQKQRENPEFKFTDEQKAVILHQTWGTGGTAIVTGRAGTGKTTVSEVAVDAFRASGRNLIGVSTGWDAAKKLESESHILSHSAEKLLTDLDNGKLVLTPRDVVIYDEAGMAGTEVIHRIQTYTDAAGAKLVLQGDSMQLQPISAGNPFALLTREIGDMSLTEVRRQRHAQDRDRVAMFYGASGPMLGTQMMRLYETQGRIHATETTIQSVDEMADHWMKSKFAESERVYLACTNADLDLLQSGIRKRRQDAGLMGKDVAQFDAKSSGRWQSLKLAQNDRIRFSSRDNKLGVYNGTKGVVKDIKPGRSPDSFVVTVRTESHDKMMDGRTVKFDTADFCSLTHNYAMTVHKSQGQGVEEVRILISPMMTDKHLQLVADTRAKSIFTMHGAQDDFELMHKRIGLERLKVNAIDQLPKSHAAEQKKPTPQITEIGAKLGEAIKTEQLRKKGKGLSMSK